MTDRLPGKVKSWKVSLDVDGKSMVKTDVKNLVITFPPL